MIKQVKSLVIKLKKSDEPAPNMHGCKQVCAQIRNAQNPLEELYGLASREKLGIKRADIAAARRELE